VTRRILLLFAGALAAACGGDAEAARSGGPPPARVVLGAVTEGALTLPVSYLGEVRATARAELAAGAEGEVLEIAVHEGDRVRRGDLLLRLDPDLARARLSAARAARRQSVAERAQASRDADRLSRAGDRTVAGVEIERAQSAADALAARTDQLQAAEREARETLSRHRVEAPFDGTVVRRLVDEGDWVGSGDAVLELVAEGRVEVLVAVEPERLSDVAVGTEVTLAGRGAPVPGHVAGVVRALDPATRTATLRVLADAPADWLLPGGTCDVRFTLAHEGEGVLIPRDALVTGVAEARVWVVEEGAPRAVVVAVRERGEDRLRVTGEGLEAGAMVIVRGNDRLRPGQPIVVVEP
jgi:RND family efflux transporter MFP subunit